jgi:hypothetical protein
MEHFTIRPAVDLDVVPILETMNSSGTSAIAPPLPVDPLDPALSSLDCWDGASSGELACPDWYFDPSEDQLNSVPRFDYDAAGIVDPHHAGPAVIVGIVSCILEDQQLLQFYCLETSCAKFVLITKSKSWIRSKRIFIRSLFKTPILLSRFLVLYPVYRQISLLKSISPSRIIEWVIRRGLINPSYTCHIAVFVQTPFHILPRRFMTQGWAHCDLTVSKLHILLAAMSQYQLTAAVSICTLCEPNVLDAKDCSKLAIQIPGALCDASSGRLSSTIEQLVCFQLITRFHCQFSQKLASDPP